MKVLQYTHRKSLWLPLLVALILASCTEKIDLELDSAYVRLVVEGAITTDTMAHRVRLTRTTDFFYNQPAPTVSGAQVTISDGSQTFPLTEDPQHPGDYLTQEDVHGVPGNTYTMHVQLQEPIGGASEYTASCMLMPVNPIDSIKVVYRDQWEIWEIQCFAFDPPAVNYYMFNTYKNGILMTDTINKVMATDDRFYNGNYTNGAGVGYLRKDVPREVVYPGDTITIQIAGITKEYLYFIWDVQTESGYQNPLISGPPANITGNINNGAIGFFAAYSVKYATTIAP